MTVTTITGSNQPTALQANTLSAAIATQTALVASFAAGSQFQNHAISKLASMQRNFVIFLMDYGLLQPATILATCTYGS